MISQEIRLNLWGGALGQGLWEPAGSGFWTTLQYAHLDQISLYLWDFYTCSAKSTVLLQSKQHSVSSKLGSMIRVMSGSCFWTSFMHHFWDKRNLRASDLLNYTLCAGTLGFSSSSLKGKSRTVFKFISPGPLGFRVYFGIVIFRLFQNGFPNYLLLPPDLFLKLFLLPRLWFQGFITMVQISNRLTNIKVLRHSLLCESAHQVRNSAGRRITAAYSSIELSLFLYVMPKPVFLWTIKSIVQSVYRCFIVYISKYKQFTRFTDLLFHWIFQNSITRSSVSGETKAWFGLLEMYGSAPGL